MKIFSAFFNQSHQGICRAAVVLAMVGIATMAQATDYYWDADTDGSAAIGGSGTWDNATSLWRLGGPTGSLTNFPIYGDPDTDVFLQGAAGTLTLGANLFVNDLNVAPTSGTSYLITGPLTLTLNGAIRSTIDVASGATLTINSGLGGANGFTKSNAGTLLLDSVQGTSNLTGAIAVTGGTLQAGSATNNAASQVLRGNAVDLAAGTTLTTVGTTVDLRVGNLSGAGSIIPATGGSINELALLDSVFSGAITASGGLNLRGANGKTQTFNGNLTGLTGTIGINSGATFLLSGTGDITNGVLGATAALATRGGTLVMDNSGGNTTASAGRYGDAVGVTLGGGSFSLIGNSAGTTENVGAFTLNSGSSTISVTNNGGTGAALTFNDSGSLRDSTAGTLNFVGLGFGALGAPGNNPRILFTGALNANTVNGALTSSASGANTVTYGWARVNGISWAGNDANNGIVALAETARNSATLGSAAANELTTFTPSTTVTTLSADLGAAATALLFKITPSGSDQSLASGGFNINASAVMLAGTTDFSISGSGSFFGTANTTRFIYTNDANTVFSISQSFAGSNQPFTKSGAGTVFLNGSANQLGFSAIQSVNLAEGVLRGTLTTLGGGTSAGGALTNLNLYGGVLEISGGGAFSRALGTNAIVGTSAGGTIKWDNNNANARGDGGFSAIGGDATVTLVTTIGGPTPSTPNWNDLGFIQNGYALTLGSTKSDSRIVFANNIGLDGGAATANYFAREVRVAAGVTGSSARLSGVLSGSANADLLKTGAGTLQLTGVNTYAGNTLVQQGTLQVGSSVGTGAGNGQLANTGRVIVNGGGTLLLGGTSASTDRLNNAAGIVLAGGAFNTGGLSEGTVTSGAPTAGLGALTLTANSILDLGNGASILAFAKSSAQSFNGTLSIYNWTGNVAGGGADEVFFGTDSTGLRPSQLNGILFYSGPGTGFLGTAGILGTGEIVPVPEPATILAGLLMVGAAGWSQRRQLRGLAGLRPGAEITNSSRPEAPIES